MQMDLITTFLDLCETRSFNQTAERLGVTQSTVSGRVKALEAEVGVSLFRRSRSGTALTTEGLRFEPHARSLRHDWVTALNATRDPGMAGVTMRIGLQHDLVSIDIKGLIDAFRDLMPDTQFLFEADYSGQICNDLSTGMQDIAVLYTPKPGPDLHFVHLGDVRYVMVSTHAETLSEVSTNSYIVANYAPVFAQTHAALLPGLSHVALSIGQNAAMVDLVTSLRGTAYILEQSARKFVFDGIGQVVAGAPVISQPVFHGLNMRNRHRPAYARLLKVVRAHYAGAP
ncbi:MAG: LysR family transcriptional regulator [Pseudomonadota bacterium]